MHSYKWMFQEAKAPLQIRKLKDQKLACGKAQLPRAPDPLTPAFGVDSTKKNGKGDRNGKSAGLVLAVPERNTSHEACPRIVSSEECSFGRYVLVFARQARD